MSRELIFPRIVERPSPLRVDTRPQHASREFRVVGITRPWTVDAPQIKNSAGVNTGSPLPSDTVTNSTGDAPPGTTVNYNGGELIRKAPTQLVFWGKGWTLPTSSPSASKVIQAVQDILSGPYMTALKQYGIGRAYFRDALIVNDDPPNPFSTIDVMNLIWDLIDNGSFPEPDDGGGQNLYVVITDSSANYANINVAVGFHGVATDYDFPLDNDKAWVAWVGSKGSFPNALDNITKTFSHELVEAVTDPEKDGYQTNGTFNGGNEIGDACNNGSGRLNGIAVQTYWSVQNNACLFPTMYSVRRIIGARFDLSKGFRVYFGWTHKILVSLLLRNSL